jgi:hypothetical protein
MVVAHPGPLKWGEAPSVLPKGAQLAVITGDPGKAGPYVIRVKIPAGYQIPAHWHSTAENLTVLSGTVNVGMGAKLLQEDQHNVVGGFVHLASPKDEPFLMGECAGGLSNSRGGTFRYRVCQPQRRSFQTAHVNVVPPGGAKADASR